MIEGITQMGQILMGKDEGGYLDLLMKPLPPERKGKKQHVVGIDFNCQKKELDFRILGEVDDQTPYKYLWVGNAPSNNDQLRLSSDQIRYLVSQSLPLLRNALPQGCDLQGKLDRIISTFFFDLGEVSGKRYRYILDTSFSGIDMDLAKRRTTIQSGDIAPEGVVKEVSRGIEKNIERIRQIKSADIGLYTISLEGQILAQSEDYRNFLRSNLQPDFDATSRGNCFICNKEDSVSSNVAKLKFKYYIQDKLSFSSDFQDSFDKNFSFCKKCYMKLSSGENFVQNNLGTKIGLFQVYLIPKFLFDVKMSKEQFRRISKGVLFHFNTVRSFEGIRAFYDRLKEDYIGYEDEQNSFILNILFYYNRPPSKEMKVLKLIKDVPPARLTTLIEATSKVRDIGSKLLGESNMWNIDLGKIYYLTPVKKSGGDPTAYKELLNLYSAIISGGSVFYPVMIKQFVELIRVYRFEKFPVYNITKPNDTIWGMTAAVVQCNLFLLYLKQLELLKGGNTMAQMDLKSVNLDEHMVNFIRVMGYSDAEIALFLLGRLIGEIGWKQGGKEPILEKISYQGMDARRLLRLTNEVFEKLKQYKVLQYNKGIFSACKMLLDKQIENWPLNDQENVFYILSGYSYRRQRAAAREESAKQEGEEDDTQQ